MYFLYMRVTQSISHFFIPASSREKLLAEMRKGNCLPSRFGNAKLQKGRDPILQCRPSPPSLCNGIAWEL